MKEMCPISKPIHKLLKPLDICFIRYSEMWAPPDTEICNKHLVIGGDQISMI